MAAPTPTQLVRELQREVDQLAATVNGNHVLLLRELKVIGEALAEVKAALASAKERVGDHVAQFAVHDQRLKVAEKQSDHPATLAAHDQRLKVLEKGSDRIWQFAAMAISVAAILVSVVVAFVKK